MNLDSFIWDWNLKVGRLIDYLRSSGKIITFWGLSWCPFTLDLFLQIDVIIKSNFSCALKFFSLRIHPLLTIPDSFCIFANDLFDNTSCFFLFRLSCCHLHWVKVKLMTPLSRICVHPWIGLQSVVGLCLHHRFCVLKLLFKLIWRWGIVEWWLFIEEWAFFCARLLLFGQGIFSRKAFNHFNHLLFIPFRYLTYILLYTSSSGAYFSFVYLSCLFTTAGWWKFSSVS